MRKIVQRSGLVLLMALLTIGISAPTIAYAYDGLGAASYAWSWAYSRNYNYPGPFDSDCTNFASQALHEGGGYPLTDFGDYSPYAWWFNPRWYGWDYSTSWTVANELRNFLLWTYPGGYDWGIQCSGGGCQNKYYNQALYGDIIFYDWESDGEWDHASVETNYNGTDNIYQWFTGDLISAHTGDRRDSEWNLWDYNIDHRYQTSVDVIHMDEDFNDLPKSTLWGVYGQYLLPNEYLTSQDGRFWLNYQNDGNLVLYQVGVGAIWSTNTITTPGYAIMQTDGNFVLYWPNGVPYWATNTWGNPGSYLTVQNDGNVVLYRSWPNQNPLWWSGTCCR